MSLISVSQLFIYPVKSLRGITIEAFDLGATGPNNDRQWMIVDAQGKFITQRTHAKMCLINTRLEGNELIINQTGHGQITVPRGGGYNLESTVWRDQVAAEDCGDEVAAWLTEVLARPCRMVYMPAGHERRVRDSSATVGFADGYPLLLTSEASLENFNSHLKIPVGINRFRPNIVISGNEAYAEDHWQDIRIGALNFRHQSPCTRCIVPSIDPENGDKQADVSRALNEFRRFGTQTRFGQNLTYAEYGSINTGDPVEILA